MNEFLEQFVLESRELVEQATADLLALENAPHDAGRLDSVFRAFHTLKGGAGIVDFIAMEHAVHAAEDGLAAVRSGERAMTGALVGDCLACLDQVVQWLDAIDRTGELPASAAAGAIVARFASDAPRESSRALSADGRSVLEAQVALLDAFTPEGWEGRVSSAARVAANVLASAGDASWAELLQHAAETSMAARDPRVLREAIEEILDGEAATLAPSAPHAPEPEPTARTLRVDTTRIDALVDLTGELTIARNAMGHAAKLIDAQAPALGALLKDPLAVLHRLTAELQHAVLGMRVLPLDHVFQRFPRLLREISAELGKPASLVVEGGDTEADKVIVENLFEPLVHVIRNAIAHGVEPAAKRAALHKPAVATIRLAASREGDHVVVEVSDDGQGIDIARIREIALERGLLDANALAAMSEEEIVDIIFEPGFSTAATVTGLSGRGVGMDAVRAAVRRLAGDVRIQTRAGSGTTIRFLLPFSVMITPIMVVGAGGQAFGIPLDAVVETLRIGTGDISAVGTAQVVVIRDRTIPLVSLATALALGQADPAEEHATVVVIEVDGQYGALRVDRVGERMEVMMKPLEGLLAGMPALAGSTILGDGSVLLILDLAAVFQ
ncbi:MAG TPA: chemotaxis protein CheA [Usitatibacter sp.]|nr:chemotaxis protein CheA [Usitatibacter sp.]